MVFSPIAGVPIVTQGFGQNPNIYSVFGYDGHNGIDFGVDVGTPIYAPHDGIATIVNDGDSGYGLYVVINDTNRRSILAHLSESLVANGQTIYQGNHIANSGNTGLSTNPHLHWTFKILKNGVVQNRWNGYDGAMDVTEYTRLWLDQDVHHDSVYTPDAQPYLAMTFPENQYLDNPDRVA